MSPIRQTSTPPFANSERTTGSGEFDWIPKEWRSADDIPSLEEICNELKHDPILFDRFAFQETNDPRNTEDGAYKPLVDMQVMITEDLEQNDIIWLQASRGSAKSYTVARWIVSYCLRFRNQKVVICAPSFRQSRQVFDYCVELLRENSGVASHIYHIEQECDLERDVKRGHEVLMVLSTGSTIEALPMGSGDTVRGRRATVLVCDEFYLFSQEMYESHIMPFLNVEMAGVKPKLIHMTTSYYQDSFAYKVLMDIAREVKNGTPGYKIIDLTINDVMDSGFPVAKRFVYHQLKTQTDPVTGMLSDTALMTFYNVWIKSSANFYKTDVIRESQVDEVHVLTRRPEGATSPFVLGVDPAGQGRDKTAMSVMSLPGDGQRHLHATYMWSKLKPEEIAGKIHEMVDRYGIKWIVMDKTGTLGADVADKCGRKMQIVNGISQECEPILTWDHPDADTARALIVLTRPSDLKISSGLFGEDYEKKIGSEIALKNAFHINMKGMMESGKFRAPKNIPTKAYVLPDGRESLAGLCLDWIRESMAQFPRIDRERTPQGLLRQNDAGCWLFTRPPEDDGAYSIIYANWCANIVYRALVVAPPSREVAAVWDAYIPPSGTSARTTRHKYRI